MGDYRRLVVWQRAYGLVLRVYKETEHYPVSERYGLLAQTRRAAVSVVANVAEGAGRSSDAEFARFLSIARGSLEELIVELALGRDLGYVTREQGEDLLGLADEVGRLLYGLLQARRAASHRSRPS